VTCCGEWVTFVVGGRGRRLIDREQLDRFIESYVGAPPSEIAMNKRRAAR